MSNSMGMGFSTETSSFSRLGASSVDMAGGVYWGVWGGMCVGVEEEERWWW